MNKQRAYLRRFRALGAWSVSRVLRWGFALVCTWWVVSNWHNDLTVNELAQKYAYPDSKWIEIDGQAIHYRVTGKGAPVLLLHDEASSMHTWQQWCDSLSGQYQVYCVDLPGFGLTGPNVRGSYSAFMYASFLEHFTDSLQLNKFTLAGVGLGAQIAWFFAAEHPERLDKLILADARGYEESDESIVTLLAQAPLVNRVIWKITPKSFFHLMLQGIYADDRLVTDSLANRHFELALRPGNRKAFTDRVSVRHNAPPVDFIERIRTPTLILWGAEDALLSTQYAYEFHRHIKGALIKIYQNTGHWPQEESGSESVADVKAFLEGRF